MKIFLAGGNGKNKIILKYANISSGGGEPSLATSPID